MRQWTQRILTDLLTQLFGHVFSDDRWCFEKKEIHFMRIPKCMYQLFMQWICLIFFLSFWQSSIISLTSNRLSMPNCLNQNKGRRSTWASRCNYEKCSFSSDFYEQLYIGLSRVKFVQELCVTQVGSSPNVLNVLVKGIFDGLLTNVHTTGNSCT
jgi:hypothetical protein